MIPMAGETVEVVVPTLVLEENEVFEVVVLSSLS
jgi:hypothetical protein